ncbi:MAG TPA: septum site-determining protein MinC [Firmicutes bacterium]|nr:septum site-determining protein MinC [Bacillota bacterium]
MDEDVVFKGTREGVLVLLNDVQDFETLCKRLKEKLDANSHFFQGAEVIVDTGKMSLSEEEVAELGDMVKASCGGKLRLRTAGSLRRTFLLKRTIRCGQEVLYDGNVVIVGDVNPGAEVIATGDIVVMGKLRGMAHAGALGDDAAVIAALKMEPLQLRIGSYISRSPDDDRANSNGPEVAMVKDGAIVIEELLEVYRNG